MRAGAVFTVFAKKTATWRQIFYYRTYDEIGFRTPVYSTGQKTKTTAANLAIAPIGVVTE
jgi:hypothetical protein